MWPAPRRDQAVAGGRWGRPGELMRRDDAGVVALRAAVGRRDRWGGMSSEEASGTAGRFHRASRVR